MTISTTENKKVYNGDGIVVAFGFPFPFAKDTDLVVSLYDELTSIEDDPETIITDYTVSGAGNPAGGTVTMVVAPTTDQKLIIRRVVDLTQLSKYEDYNRFPAATIVANLDNLTVMVQQLNEEIDRCQKFDASIDSSVVSAIIKGALVAGGVPVVDDDLKGVTWVDLDANAIAAAVASTAADAVSTAADVVTTNADVVSTNADAVSTAADAASAAASALIATAVAKLNDIHFSCTANDQVVIALGSLFTGVDSGNQFTFAENRTFDITGTAGTLGSLNTGTESADAWYFLIALGDTTGAVTPHIIGVTPANYASFTTADLTGNYAAYDDYKRIGCIRNKGGIFLTGYFRDGFYYYNVAPLALPTTASTSFASQSLVIWVPPVSQELSCRFKVNGAANVFWMTDSSVGTGVGMPVIISAMGITQAFVTLALDTSQAFDWKTSANTLSISEVTRYKDSLIEEGQ